MPGANPLTMNRKELEVEVGHLRALLDQKSKQLKEEREGYADSMNEMNQRIDALTLELSTLKQQVHREEKTETKNNEASSLAVPGVSRHAIR